jgi:hypothetical protein
MASAASSAGLFWVEMGVSQTFCLGWPGTVILQISAFQDYRLEPLHLPLTTVLSGPWGSSPAGGCVSAGPPGLAMVEDREQPLLGASPASSTPDPPHLSHYLFSQDHENYVASRLQGTS